MDTPDLTETTPEPARPRDPAKAAEPTPPAAAPPTPSGTPEYYAQALHQRRYVRLARLGLILVGAYDRAPAALRDLRLALRDYRYQGRVGGRAWRATLLVSGAERCLRYLLQGWSASPAAQLAQDELAREADAL